MGLKPCLHHMSMMEPDIVPHNDIGHTFSSTNLIELIKKGDKESCIIVRPVFSVSCVSPPLVPLFG